MNERDDLSKLLQSWEPPPVPDGLDDRVLAAYRRLEAPRAASLWRRFLAAEIRIPLPLAAAAILLLVVTTFLVWHRAAAVGGTAGRPVSAPVQAVRADTPLVTETSLAGFKPVEEMQVTVMEDHGP